MLFRNYCSLLLGVLTTLQGVPASGSAMRGMDDAILIQQEQVQRLHDFLGPISNPNTPKPPATITFNNPAAKKFFVDGNKIPEGNPSTLMQVHRMLD
ncbi:hypothetical protein C0991_007245 [Blastosporella zonata]|nr:hypothetical protein C0991_007245 [Blastosporella zonata]